jgi:hypothetical protein
LLLYFGLQLSTAFLAYVLLIGALVAAILRRYLPVGRALIGLAIVAIWLGYAGAVGYSGIVSDARG